MAAIPDDWERVAARHVGPFVTGETFKRADGELIKWESRAHRKFGRGQTGSTWWAPHAIAWWIGVLFMIGSACFVVGPFPGYLSWVGYRADAMTFFVGSIFFTSAALLQLIEAGRPRARAIGWWACSVQFVGTLFFNVTTFNAFHTDLSASQAKAMIWTPDWRGSICFLIASELAYIEVGHSFWSWSPHNRSWRIAALNMVGSIAFGVSAVASYILPTTGAPLSVFWTNFGTGLGAICFFAGAFLLLPERTHPDDALAST